MWLFILEGAATVLFGLALRVRAQHPSVCQCRLVSLACAAPVSPACSCLPWPVPVSLGLQTRARLTRKPAPVASHGDSRQGRVQ
jgi:hypothetical protein